MKLLFVIKALDGIKGGAERVLCTVASGLAARGHEVTILSFDPQGGVPFYPLSPLVRRLTLGIGNPYRSTRVSEIFARMVALRQAVQNLRPDVAIGFMHSAFIPLSFSLVGTRTPVVASEHIVPLHYRERPVEYFFLMLSAVLVRRVTILSQAVAQMYPWLIRRRAVIMPNPVTPAGGHADVCGPRLSGGNTLGKRTLLCIGRLDPQKDHAVLIDAFARVQAQFPDWQLKIFGEGPLREELQGQIDFLGLGGRIVLAGTTQAIGAEYAAAQLFVIPSRYESFGLVTAEAMSYGLPAVGFADCPGTNELIVDGVNGVLVGVSQGESRAQTLAASLARLMADDDLRARLGAAAPKTAAAFNPETIISKWEEMLTHLHAG